MHLYCNGKFQDDLVCVCACLQLHVNMNNTLCQHDKSSVNFSIIVIRGLINFVTL